MMNTAQYIQATEQSERRSGPPKRVQGWGYAPGQAVNLYAAACLALILTGQDQDLNLNQNGVLSGFGFAGGKVLGDEPGCFVGTGQDLNQIQNGVLSGVGVAGRKVAYDEPGNFVRACMTVQDQDLNLIKWDLEWTWEGCEEDKRQ